LIERHGTRAQRDDKSVEHMAAAVLCWTLIPRGEIDSRRSGSLRGALEGANDA
jgi:hypothetical protein